MKHLLGRRFIDFAVRVKDVHAPFFISEPSEHACLDRREVSHNKTAAWLRYERRANELRERTRSIVKQHFERFEIAVANQAARRVKLTVRHFVLR